jgi:FtsP/CotA-like multicopper oxidase with cupredoxin domain
MERLFHCLFTAAILCLAGCATLDPQAGKDNEADYIAEIQGVLQTMEVIQQDQDTANIPVEKLEEPKNKRSDSYSASGNNKDCIMSLKISATTGTKNSAGFSSAPMSGETHHIALQLNSNQIIRGSIKGPAVPNQPFTSEMDLATDFDGGVQCVKEPDIKDVSLVAGGNDRWHIVKITTYVKTELSPYRELTSDLRLNKWLDRNGHYPYDASKLHLNLEYGRILGDTSNHNQHDVDTPSCGYSKPFCECRSTALVCIFNLEIDEIRTFTSYRKHRIAEGVGMFTRGVQGVIYHIENDGEARPLEQYSGRECADGNFPSEDCSDPQFVDGETYRMATAVNGQIPGPTIIVHEGQTVVIHVHNNLTSEGISIHWHGMHQRGTPWMDGVGQVTQCQIGAFSSYSYIYTATPSGTFWYHSHSGAQRTDGFFGALIVKENSDTISSVKNRLESHGVNRNFLDYPGLHSITLMDWQHEASLDLFSQLYAGLGFHPDVPIGKVPPSDQYSRYASTHSHEDGVTGAIPFFSGLINGKGRHRDVPYARSRLSIFTVRSGQSYRFRLVGSQGLYPFKLSIDGHKLIVVGTDGYWIQPQTNVDYLIIQTGERYDFILEANAGVGQYRIRAETLEVDTASNGGFPPFRSYEHVAEAILQVVDTPAITDSASIPSTRYAEIQNLPLNCPRDGCRAVNCPFQDFHSSYNITCINVNQLRLLLPTPAREMPARSPSATPGATQFFNFNFEGETNAASINGRNFVFPPAPPQTQFEAFDEQATVCDVDADCNPFTLDCLCTHMVSIPGGDTTTVQFIFTSLGIRHTAHPIHLHGHTFHVVHVGYPEYITTTGFVDPENHNSDIRCDDDCDPCVDQACDKCTKPTWESIPEYTLDNFTIRKDTVIVPAGGYVVINFLSDNPGYWFLHCHIEIHQLGGMAAIIREGNPESLSPPEGLNRCGDYNQTVPEYIASIPSRFRSG